MQFITVAALFAGIAAAAETATIYNFNYNRVNGYPIVSFFVAPGNFGCVGEHFVVDGPEFTCEDAAWKFQVKAEEGSIIKLSHTVDGATYAADFKIRMNGPIPTVLDQIGNSTATLEPVN